MTVDPFGCALRDHSRDDRAEPLLACDGPETIEHPIEEFYFGAFSTDSEGDEWLSVHVSGPLLDVGAGAGRHAHYFQDRFETVAIEVSEALVTTMDERGVRDARHVDMFALRESFERDRFAAVLCIGTQVGLAGSMGGFREFLCDLAFVTTPGATAVLDCYDPDREGCEGLLGYRADPTPGLASRAFWFEYEGAASSVLSFRLFSPDRVREATIGTDWEVREIRYGENGSYYRAALEKR